MICAVLFDFYGTVARAASWGPTRHEVLASHGYGVPPDVHARSQQQTLDGLEHAEHSQSRAHYLAWERDRLRGFVRECGVGGDDAERLVDDLEEASSGFTMVAYPEAAEVLAEVRSQGLVVAMCSNWSWDLDRAVAQCGLGGAFDVVVASARAGARKPHHRIFEVTLAEAGVAAGEALFVGDSFGPDVEGPLAAGMGAVQICRAADKRPRPPLPKGATRAGDLRGVLELLARVNPTGTTGESGATGCPG